ncbi:unnamed protein product [Cercopithifilaria johnstoni]|uniref:Uncharacterized protein n=1 Tax=Cercopithifilaria johnstoni TaxID=2874296 RepID=A0A8J2M0S6_9BILA|nr:unnamed protein product [Cercopithifilaria johnstoni]
MRIFNVDRVHSTIFNHSIFAVNRNTQTDWCRMNQKVQIGVTMRHVAIQSKRTQVKERTKRHVTTKDAAVQFSTNISQQQLTKVIAEMICQILAVNEKKQQLQKNSGIELSSIIGKNLNQIKFDDLSGRKINLPKKPAMKKNVEYFNEAQKQSSKCQRLHKLKLANLNNNFRKGNLVRLCNKPKLETNKLQLQHYANFINNPPTSYNVICRRQLLHKLDQLIDQKATTLQKIQKLKSVNLNDTTKNSKRKIQRLCQISSNPLHQSNKQQVLLSTGKNTANISMLNDNWQLAKSTNQILTQKLNDSNKNSFDNSKLPLSSTTINECTSGSTVRNSFEKLKKNLVTEEWRNSGHTISGSDPETSSDSDSDIASVDKNDNDKDNSMDSTARTASSEFSSEALTITSELQSIK